MSEESPSASGLKDGGGAVAAVETAAARIAVKSAEGRAMRAASSTGGPAIVLTADRTLLANYSTLLDGMSAASQTTWLPSRMMHWWVAPSVRATDRGRAARAPLGLRRLEAALLAHGFEGHEVAIVPPEALERVVTSRTRIIGVSSGDPLGCGMNSTTVAALFGGAPITSHCCGRLIERINRLRMMRAPDARLVLGGPGAWQFHDRPAALTAMGIDHLVTGYAEASFPELVEQLMGGGSVEAVVRGRGLPASELPPLAGPTVMGMVEVSRGCGWGCRFCTLSDQPMAHLLPETVLVDVETNLSGGMANIALGSEDFFRYGGRGGVVSADSIIDLLRNVRRLEGVRTLSIDHANIASIAAIDDAALGEIGQLLRGGSGAGAGAGGGPRPWVNLGVETASGRLLASQGGGRKMQPFGVDGWADACEEQIRRLVKQGYFPLVSLVIGLAGETAEDVAMTSRWVERLADLPLAVVPLLLAPLGEADGQTSWIRPDQWALLGQGMEMTFRHMPGLYWEHHGAAGVNVFRRIALQAMGKGYALMWRGRQRRCQRRAGER